MKKAILATALFITAAITVNKAEAQVRLNVNVNIGSQPVWGPVGYNYVEYYYLPDIEAYYYVPRHQFIYLSGNRWIFSASLPPRYHDYDLYSGYKVVVNEPRPYLHFDHDRTQYGRYRGYHSQEIIRNSNDSRYYIIKGHPKYNHGGGNGNSHGNGNGKGHGNGRGH
ncbi:MAG TPA: hypothetical protein VKC90_14365 [Chitinophagaceae bacterium]|nr:hypothetical protein [Chitinophagaceae bacterium]